MANPKKLDLSIEQLVSIASAINENTTMNKSRSKENKIPTDKFIKQFGLNRKDFSETIKDTEIKYNTSTFMYDIPEHIEKVNFSITKVNLVKPLESQEVNLTTTKALPQKKEKLQKYTKVLQKYTKEFPREFQEIIDMAEDMKQVISWYKIQTNSNIIEVNELNINNSKLDGEVTTKSYKVYKSVADDFSRFADGRKESIKDLVSLALLEFIRNYKK